MKINKRNTFGITLCLVSSVLLFHSESNAAPELDNDSIVEIEGREVTLPVDPENPGELADPGKSPSTEGDLRVDFVSTFNFGRAQLQQSESEDHLIFHALAQQFYSETGPRGSYIQITDQREKSTGWSLQVKQNYQFRNPVIQEPGEQELHGAVLSLDKGWANSSGSSDVPTVTRETIELQTIGAAYELATAVTGGGQGVWTISFGASENNKSNQSATLAPITDEEGNAITDETYGKDAYSNSAITLTIPKTTKIHPVQYETELTWILSEVP